MRLLVASLLASNAVAQYTVISQVPGNIPFFQTVEVSCEFTNSWSAASHPIDFPNNAHWSPMVLASHTPNFEMWTPTWPTDEAIRNVAETGNTDKLDERFDHSGLYVLDSAKGSAIYLSDTQTTKIGPVALDLDRSYLSTISMIAPSPDWFSGFNSYNVLDDLSEMWHSSFIIETYPWDATTDNGTTYESADSPTAWDRPFQLTTETIPDSGVFLSPDETTVNSVAIWSCQVTATTPAPTTSPAPTISFRPSLAPTNTMEPTVQFSMFPTDTESMEPSAAPSTVASAAALESGSMGPTPLPFLSAKPSTEASTAARDSPSMGPTALSLPYAQPSTEAPTAVWDSPSMGPTEWPLSYVEAFMEAPTAAWDSPTMGLIASSSSYVEPSPEEPTAALDSLIMDPTAWPFSYSTEPGNIPAVEDVVVTCVFENEWWKSTHPNDYPDDAHWSPMVLASHSDGYELWRPGDFASKGVQQVAETGNFSTLETELNAADATVLDYTFGYTMHNSDSHTQTFSELRLDFVHSYVSTISMVGPSPDWFSGFPSFRVIDPKTGMWYSSFTIDTYPYDAATDSGTTYKSENNALDPHSFIYPLTAETVPESGVFMVPNGTTVLPVATWTCTVQLAQEMDVGEAEVKYLRASGAFAHSLMYSCTLFAIAWTMLCTM